MLTKVPNYGGGGRSKESGPPGRGGAREGIREEPDGRRGGPPMDRERDPRGMIL
jgi:hypothetical protein